MRVKSKKQIYFTDFFTKTKPLQTHVRKTPPLRSHYRICQFIFGGNISLKRSFQLFLAFKNLIFGGLQLFDRATGGFHFSSKRIVFLLHSRRNYQFYFHKNFVPPPYFPFTMTTGRHSLPNLDSNDMVVSSEIYLVALSCIFTMRNP